MENFFSDNQVLLGVLAIIGFIISIIQLLHNFTNSIQTKWAILFWSIGVISYVGLFLLAVGNPILLTLLISTTIFSLIFLTYHTYYIKNKLRRGNLKPEHSQLKYQRFESIKEIKYGFVVYKPFFWVEDSKGVTPQHNGIGYKVLTEILKPNNLNKITLTPCSNGSNWDSIFKELENGNFDIIIAPLFETRTRLFDFNVAFCSPLFYSNIGLYIKKSAETQSFENSFTFTEAIEHITKQIDDKGWKGGYLKNELSDSLLKKYKLKSIEVKQTTPTTDADFKQIIQNIASGHKDKEDFTFMEVFKAESIIDQNTQVVNILKNNELLYPVSFVVRKQETVLKNLINVRLMEMESTVIKDSSGKDISELENIIKNVAITAPIKIEESKFKNIFIRKYDFRKLEA